MLITRSRSADEQTQQVTDVLLQNVRVIAMDQDAKGADGTAEVARTATLEVTPLDAQKLALGQQVGSSAWCCASRARTEYSGVETVSLDDLRYSYYGGARYPGSRPRRSTSAARCYRRRAPAGAPAGSGARAGRSPAHQADVEIVYRGTESNDYEVGGYARKDLKRRAALARAAAAWRPSAAAAAGRGADAASASPMTSTPASSRCRVNKSQVLRSDRPFAKALIGNPEIADVLPLTDQSLYVLGKKIGHHQPDALRPSQHADRGGRRRRRARRHRASSASCPS